MHLEDLTRAIPLVATDYCVVERRAPDGALIDHLHLPATEPVLDRWNATKAATDGRLWVSVGGLDWLWVEDTEGTLEKINRAAAAVLHSDDACPLPVTVNRRRTCRYWETVADDPGLVVSRTYEPAPATAPRAVLVKDSDTFENPYLEAEVYALLGDVPGDPQTELSRRLGNLAETLGGDLSDPGYDLAWLDGEAGDEDYRAAGLVQECVVTVDGADALFMGRHDVPWTSAT